MKKLKNSPVLFSLLIITIYSLLTTFIFIPFLGFYNDDWLFGYLGQFYGPQGLIQGFAGDRPIVGYLFAINQILLGNNLYFWHIYMFLMRLFGGYILFFLLKKLWPNRLAPITCITLLFLIYPGFLQQSVPLGYQNYITALTIWIASMFFTALAIKSLSKFKFILFTLMALILQIFSFLLLEFFIGMEILRLLLIVYSAVPAFTETNIIKLKKQIRYLSPYIVSLMLFVLWRIFVFKSVRSATSVDWITQTYYSDPYWIAKIPLKILYSFISTVILPYFIPIMIRLVRIPLESSVISLFVGIASSTLLYSYNKTIEKFQEDQISDDFVSKKDWGQKLLLIGVVSILAALLPIIISGRFVTVSYDLSAFDRYTISSIIGVGFIITGFLLYKASSMVRHWIIILLVSLSITTHLMNGYWRTELWDKQKNIWWQLYWRTSKIQKNTLLIFDSPEVIDTIKSKDLSITLFKTLRPEDYQIWAPGNLFFNYSDPPANHFSGQYLSNKDTVQKISNKIIESVAQESSTIKYTKNFNNTVIISTPNDNSCLWVLDKSREELPANASKLVRSNIIYSNIDKLIQKDAAPATPPAHIFGYEPSHGWCYYFQKASLLRQLENWDKLNILTQEVIDKNLKPKDPNEWLPFIEGLIVAKKSNQAEALIKTASEKEPEGVFIHNLCKMVKRLDNAKLETHCKYLYQSNSFYK